MEKYSKIQQRVILVFFLYVMFIFCGCKKLIEISAPNTSLNSENIYNTDATAASVLTGMYANLSNAGIQGGAVTSVGFLTGLSADELTLFNAEGNETLSAYYSNNLNAHNGWGTQFWNSIYPTIYVINSAIEGVSNSKTLTLSVKRQLLGEAKFMRALNYFYLVNLYGDIPLILTTDYQMNKVAARASKEKVWSQIILDLKDAQSMLSSGYLDATIITKTQDRVRPNQFAATALLARAYLYIQDWQNAIIEASRVLESADYKLVELDNVFLKNSMEAIWQLQPVFTGMNSFEADTYVPNPNYGSEFNQVVELNQSLLAKFDSGDQRKIKWIGSLTSDGRTFYYAYKYKVFFGNSAVTEYPTVLRLAEQYLIRAEARIKLGMIGDGIDDLNQLRARATDHNAALNIRLQALPNNLSKDDALVAVEKERIAELFTEWGHRWFDLKRTGSVDATMSIELPKKVVNGIWKSYQQLYPLPEDDIRHNSNLLQNKGY